MSGRGLLALLGVATFVGIAGLLAIDELCGPQYRKQIKVVRLPQVAKDDEKNEKNVKDHIVNMESILPSDVNEKNEQEMIDMTGKNMTSNNDKIKDDILEVSHENENGKSRKDDVIFEFPDDSDEDEEDPAALLD